MLLIKVSHDRTTAEEDRMTAREEGTEGRGGREGGMEGEREGG